MSCYQFNSGHDDHVRILRSPGLSFRQFFFFFFFASPSYPPSPSPPPPFSLPSFTRVNRFIAILQAMYGAPFAKILSSTPRSHASFRLCVQRYCQNSRKFQIVRPSVNTKIHDTRGIGARNSASRSLAPSISDVEN